RPQPFSHAHSPYAIALSLAPGRGGNRCRVRTTDTKKPEARLSAPRPARSSLAGIPMSDETLGLWLGFIGVVMFAITLPATRVAVGAESAPQLPPLFVTSA